MTTLRRISCAPLLRPNLPWKRHPRNIQEILVFPGCILDFPATRIAASQYYYVIILRSIASRRWCFFILQRYWSLTWTLIAAGIIDAMLLNTKDDAYARWISLKSLENRFVIIRMIQISQHILCWRKSNAKRVKTNNSFPVE